MPLKFDAIVDNFLVVAARCTEVQVVALYWVFAIVTIEKLQALLRAYAGSLVYSVPYALAHIADYELVGYR